LRAEADEVLHIDIAITVGIEKALEEGIGSEAGQRIACGCTGLHARCSSLPGAGLQEADKGGQAVRILFGSQIGIAPPTFAISINHPVDLHFSYRRYLENQIREVFGFEGTPIRIKVRYRRRKPRS